MLRSRKFENTKKEEGNITNVSQLLKGGKAAEGQSKLVSVQDLMRKSAVAPDESMNLSPEQQRRQTSPPKASGSDFKDPRIIRPVATDSLSFFDLNSREVKMRSIEGKVKEKEQENAELRREINRLKMEMQRQKEESKREVTAAVEESKAGKSKANHAKKKSELFDESLGFIDKANTTKTLDQSKRVRVSVIHENSHQLQPTPSRSTIQASTHAAPAASESESFSNTLKKAVHRKPKFLQAYDHAKRPPKPVEEEPPKKVEDSLSFISESNNRRAEESAPALPPRDEEALEEQKVPALPPRDNAEEDLHALGGGSAPGAGRE